MNQFKPVLSDTEVFENNHTWRPSSFKNFCVELDGLQKNINEALHFRGHRDVNWLIDSTVARSLKKQNNIYLFYDDSDMNNPLHQYKLANLYIQKMKRLNFSPELKALKDSGIDLLFEMYRHHQQNPEFMRVYDIEPRGTNFIDFTLNSKVGLFFANLNRDYNSEGALFVVRQTAIGAHLLRSSFSEILVLLEKHISEKSNVLYSYFPYWVFPEKQISNSSDLKPHRQDAIYYAQMDLRVDLELAWQKLAQQTNNQVFVKLILPKGTTEEVDAFLKSEGITEEYLFPPSVFDKKHKMKEIYMKLPERFPFNVEILHNGKILEMTPEYLKETKQFDPFCKEREECKKQMSEKILNPFRIFLIKFPLLKSIFKTDLPSFNSDILLFNIIEDAARQNISDLDEIMKSFSDFLDKCKGEYTKLFRKKSQDLLIDMVIKGDNSKEIALKQHRDEINNKREKLFLQFNQNGNPTNESFKRLKTEVGNLRSSVKYYRDKVAAHNDSMNSTCTIHWEDVDKSVERFKEIVFDFYIVLSFEQKYAESTGPGIYPQKTMDVLIKQIFG